MQLCSLTTLLVLCVVAMAITEAQRRGRGGWRRREWQKKQNRQSGQSIPAWRRRQTQEQAEEAEENNAERESEGEGSRRRQRNRSRVTTRSPTTPSQGTTTNPTTLSQGTTISPTTRSRGTTLILTTLSLGTTLSPTTLSQATTLSPTTLSQATTLSPTTLAQGTTLSPTTLSQATTLSPTTLSQGTTLSQTTLSQGTTLSATTLSQGTTFSPTSPFQGMFPNPTNPFQGSLTNLRVPFQGTPSDFQNLFSQMITFYGMWMQLQQQQLPATPIRLPSQPAMSTTNTPITLPTQPTSPTTTMASSNQPINSTTTITPISSTTTMASSNQPINSTTTMTPIPSTTTMASSSQPINSTTTMTPISSITTMASSIQPIRSTTIITSSSQPISSTTTMASPSQPISSTTIMASPNQPINDNPNMTPKFKPLIPTSTITPLTQPLLPTLASNLGLNTLAGLVTLAGLNDTLSSLGPLTVFGPSDLAFSDAYNAMSTNISFNPLMNADLSALLTYHALSSTTFSTALQNEQLVNSVQGAPIRFNTYPATTGAITAQCKPIDVTRVDNEAMNGVLHVIDGVMIPPTSNIVDILNATQGFSTFSFAIEMANLAADLSGTGPFTVFAPTDDAWNKLPTALMNLIISNVTSLQEVITYHVVPGTQCSAGLTSGLMTTANRADIEVVVGAAGVSVNNATVLEADVSVTNGVVHVIDQVLIPPYLVNNLQLGNLLPAFLQG